MAYVDQNLISGETVHYRTGLHWAVLVTPIVLASVLGLISLFAMFGGALPVGLVLLLVAVFMVVSGFLSRSSSEFAVTNKRVILKAGFTGRSWSGARVVLLSHSLQFGTQWNSVAKFRSRLIGHKLP